MKNREDASFINAFKDIYSYLKQRNYTPKLHVLGNEVSKEIVHYIKNEEKANIQFVEPHQHRVNAAERAIQTFKNHFIAGLSTVDPTFPLQLWDELLTQAQDSLNLLRASCQNNKISAYAVLEGEFNFNRTPPLPPQEQEH